MNKYQAKYLASLTPEELEAYKERNRQLTTQANKKHRQEAVAFLGGKCVVCGIDDIRVLQVDHVYGGGSQEFKRKSRKQMLAMIKASPSRYQLLCANHNFIKLHENEESKTRAVKT